MSTATQNAPAVGGGTTKQGFSPMRGIKAVMNRVVNVVSGNSKQKWVAPPEQPTKDSKTWSGATHKFLAKKDHSISDEAKKELRKSRKKFKKNQKTRSEYFKKARDAGRKSRKATKAERVKARKEEADAKKENKRPPVLKTAGKGKSGRPVKPAQKNCDVIYEVGSKTKYDKTNRSKQFKEYRKQAFKDLKSKGVPRVASAAHAVHYDLIFHVGKNQRYQKRSSAFRKYRNSNSGANKKDLGVKVIYEVGKAAPKA